jgi:hypothetical protein
MRRLLRNGQPVESVFTGRAAEQPAECLGEGCFVAVADHVSDLAHALGCRRQVACRPEVLNGRLEKAVETNESYVISLRTRLAWGFIAFILMTATAICIVLAWR